MLRSGFVHATQTGKLPVQQVVLHRTLGPTLLPILSCVNPTFINVVANSVIVRAVCNLPKVKRLFIGNTLGHSCSLILDLAVLINTLAVLFGTVISILCTIVSPGVHC